jgi:N4-gp56 family major capsid protein
MAIEYAAKYSGKVDERFSVAAKTARAVNNDYDFTGVDTVKVYSIPTVELGDYSLTGTNRYGEPAELQNSVQTMLLTQDKAFTFTLDKKSEDDTEGAMQAGRALRRQIDEVIIPTVDKYRLATMAEGAGTTKTGAVSNTTAYSVFLDGQNALMENGVPETGRVAFVSPVFYKSIKTDSSFIKAGDASQEMLIIGSVGVVDGVNIVPVPTSYLPTGVAFILTHQVATVSPVKLETYKIHDNPPGINGKLVEGRIRYDAFVLKNKEGAIYVHKTA